MMSDEYTAFQYDLLSALHAVGPAHGLGVKSTLESEYGYGEVNHGRMYPNLDRLVDAGLIEKSSRDRRTNEYEITEDGLGALDARIAELKGEHE